MIVGRLMRLPPLHSVRVEIVRQPDDEGPGELKIEGRAYEFDKSWALSSGGKLVCLLWPSGAEKPYEVAEIADGRHDCTCDDFNCRSGPQSRPCKHIVALAQVGLFTRLYGAAAPEHAT